jgi:hypothetical protein
MVALVLNRHSFIFVFFFSPISVHLEGKTQFLFTRHIDCNGYFVFGSSLSVGRQTFKRLISTNVRAKLCFKESDTSLDQIHFSNLFLLACKFNLVLQFIFTVIQLMFHIYGLFIASQIINLYALSQQDISWTFHSLRYTEFRLFLKF